MPVREVNEAVATKNHVDAREFVACYVEECKSCLAVSVVFLIAGDEIGNDVCANVFLDAEMRFFHPVEVAAGSVEQRARADLFKKDRQLETQFRRARKTRSRTGYRLLVAPSVLGVERRKRRCHVRAWREHAACEVLG